MIGWAVVEHHYGGGEAHERRIEPVLVDTENSDDALTLSEYQENRHEYLRTRLVQVPPPHTECIVAQARVG